MKPCVSYPEDGSTSIEWIGDGIRFAISLEKNLEDSGWYFVSKDDMAEYGSLPEELLCLLRKAVN